MKHKEKQPQKERTLFLAQLLTEMGNKMMKQNKVKEARKMSSKERKTNKSKPAKPINGVAGKVGRLGPMPRPEPDIGARKMNKMCAHIGKPMKNMPRT